MSAPDPSPLGPPAPVRALGTGGALVLALAVAVGALVARPLPLALPIVTAGVALALRRPAAVVLAGALAASALGARAEAGMEPPARRSVDAVATLAADPEQRWGRVEVVARLDGRLVLVEADGAAGEVIGARLAGERVRVEGRLGPAPGDAPWLRVRHVSGSLAVHRASPAGAGAVPWQVANRLRRLLADGAAPLGEERRALYLGLVLGDDRDQTPAQTDDFRGSGLSHLLAVSGQNVAFVIAVALPVLRRLSLRGRTAATLALLGLFVVLTRAEPSVLRAVAMAGAAVVATARGRPTTALHLMGLAAAACVLVDPFLVRSVGFHLSLAATAGILVLGPPLARALPGPRPVALPVAVSAAAQLGVAPLVVTSFDGVPVASLPANLLAAPAAAVVMTWGLPAGAVAGLAGPPVDGLAHLPTRAALAWIEAVARDAAGSGLGLLGLVHVVVLGLAVGLAVLGSLGRSADPVPSPRRAATRWTAALAVVATLAAPSVAQRHPPALVVPVEGVAVWRAGATVVVVDPGTGPAGVLEALRLAAVRRVDLVVVGGASGADEADAARHRAAVRAVWWRGRSPPLRVRLGRLQVVAVGDEVRVRAGPAG